jgi:hypothetical protein
MRGLRASAAAAVLALLLAYYVGFRWLPNLPTGWDVAFIGGVLIAAVFGLVWFALPLRRSRGLFLVGVAFAALAAVTSAAGLEIVANFAKLAAATAIAFWFLTYFESVLWVALVALMIPFVDAYSVWRGPTRHIISERPEVFSALAFAFPLPGERQAFVSWRAPLAGEPDGYDVMREPGGKRNDELLNDQNDDGEVGWLESELEADRDYTYTVVAVDGRARNGVRVVARAEDANDGPQRGDPSVGPRDPTSVEVDSADSSAKLGIPDLLFFALFLAAADRFGLRRRLTWLLLTASFGTTLALTYVFYLDGLPALPLLAFGFLLANADLLWQRFKTRRDS